MSKPWFLMVSILYTFSSVFAQSLQFKGEASAWGGLSEAQVSRKFYGIRYIPEAFLYTSINDALQLDAEISLNLYYNGQFEKSDQINDDGDINPYRIWVRFSSNQFEARLGLQKINFGAATLFRPLMWFDSIDPRDPLQITEGVYGILLRYYFLNNANIWFWGLYGNDQPKGWEFHPTQDNTVEFGGRGQYPVPGGEVGLSYHQRRMQLNPDIYPVELFGSQTALENRVGVDGRWDIEIGIWGEFVLSRQNNELLPYEWRRLSNFGADYTFGLGNGLHILAEHFISEEADNAFGWGDGIYLTALSFNYPFGVVDQLEGIFYYDWENEDFYRFFNWRRVYDHWTFFLMLFWNPEQALAFPNQPGTNNFSGKGFQLMLVFNH